MRSIGALLATATLVLAACGGEPDDPGDADEAPPTDPTGTEGGDRDRPDAPASADHYRFPPPPDVGDAPTPEATAAYRRVIASLPAGSFDGVAFADAVAVSDPRHAWLLTDLLRFFQGSAEGDLLVGAFEQLTGVDLDDDPESERSVWSSSTNHLIAWDLPAPDDYRELKGELLTLIEPAWEPFFDDADAAIDWRWVSWGGVLIDDRPLGDPSPCPEGCIPSLDDPALTDADGGDWYPDDGIVFGVVHAGEAVAFPKRVMQVHEMVNLTIGGERVGIPYCTLCGSAQAYLTDRVPDGVETPVLRTSGLLSRSNKVMYDLVTDSVFDTFTGVAISGPLHDAGVELEQLTVAVSTWGDWKQAHPDTSIVAEDGGIGRSYPDDPLGGRDDDGPIFPVGDVDPRLDVQAPVVGVVTDDGAAIAFDAEAARTALGEGAPVRLGGVELIAEGGGLAARTDAGEPVAVHEAFWFAWSQFHPGTALWPADRDDG